MSDLFRSAISSRLAKLPADIPVYSTEDDEDEGAEAADSIGTLPGSGMGPPAMQVTNSFDSLQDDNLKYQSKAIQS